MKNAMKNPLSLEIAACRPSLAAVMARGSTSLIQAGKVHNGVRVRSKCGGVSSVSVTQCRSG